MLNISMSMLCFLINISNKILTGFCDTLIPVLNLSLKNSKHGFRQYIFATVELFLHLPQFMICDQGCMKGMTECSSDQ